MKKGKMAWEYLAAIVLGLIVVIVMLLFSDYMRQAALESVAKFWEMIFGF